MLLKLIRASASADEIVALAKQTPNWQEIAVQAGKLGVAPLLYGRLQNIEKSIPAKVMRNLRASYFSNAARNLARRQELLKLLRLFQENGIDSILLKGAAVGETLYPSPAQRQYCDIDLLIRGRDRVLAQKIMLEQGYHLQVAIKNFHDPEALHDVYLKPLATGPLQIEIHWALFSSTIKFIPTEKIWEKAGSLTLFDQTARQLDPTHNLIFTIFHLSRHYFLPLKSFCDLDRLLTFQGGSINWDYLIDFSQKEKKKTLVYLGLFLTQQLFGSPVPPMIIKQIRPSRRIIRFYSLFLNAQKILAQKAALSPNFTSFICKTLLFERGHWYYLMRRKIAQYRAINRS